MEDVGSRHVRAMLARREVLSPDAVAPMEPLHAGFFEMLWRRRLVVVLVGASTLLLAAVYLLFARPLYTSTALLHIRSGAPRVLVSENPVASRQPDSYLFTEAEVIKSAPILNGALSAVSASEMQTFSGVDSPLEFLKTKLSVELGKRDEIITISFDAPDAEEGARLVNAVVDAYIRHNTIQNRSTAGELADILIQEKAKREAELVQRSKALADFKVASGTISFDSDRGNVVLERLGKLSDALTEAELAAIQAKATYDAAQAVSSSPAKMRRLVEIQRSQVQGATLGPDQELQEAKSDLAKLESQMLVLRQRYGEGHSALKSAREMIQQDKDRIAQLDKEFCEAWLGAARETWVTAQSKAKEIRSEVEKQQDKAKEQNARAAQYAMLEAERARVQKVCDALDARIKELNVSENVGSLNIRIVERADKALWPSKPSKLKVLALATVLGLLLGSGFAMIFDHRDRRIYSVEDVHSQLAVPLLGTIPQVGNPQASAEIGQMVYLEPLSEFAESFRTIRTALYFGGGKIGTVVVTSPAPSEGKSVVASNLAIAMAQAGRRVLLLDADFRRPSQHRIFSAPLENGVSNILGGECLLEAAITRTSVPNLDLLLSGQLFSNPAEVLNSSKFGHLLGELRTRYDHVVIDSPPVGVVTDAQILSAIADGTVLVLKAQSSDRTMALRARDSVLSVGGYLLGLVINAVPGRGRLGSYYGSDTGMPRMRLVGLGDERALPARPRIGEGGVIGD